VSHVIAAAFALYASAWQVPFPVLPGHMASFTVDDVPAVVSSVV
jgi:hypothetical protein